MKIGILKIGANITQSTSIKTASNFDIFSLTDALIEKGHSVHIITKKTRNTVINEPYKLHEIMKVKSGKGLDLIMVFNGAVNFFGGKESPELIQNYKIINNFDGPIFYVMTDCRFPFKQVWPVVNGKEWRFNYKQNELLVTRKDINYLYQGSDKLKLLKLLNKGNSTVKVELENIHIFMISWAIMLHPPQVVKTPYNERKWDLFYAGANRDKNRENKLIEYYDHSNNDSIHVALGGSVKHGFKCDSELSTIPNSEFIKTLGKSKATVIIGDKFYEDNFITLRVFESIIAGCITFIDFRFDSHKHIYSWMEDKTLKEFLYIKNKKELEDRLHKLSKMKEDEIMEIRRKQYKAISKLDTKSKYVNYLIEILNRG